MKPKYTNLDSLKLKESNKERAEKHVSEMYDRFGKEIKTSIQNTILYEDIEVPNKVMEPRYSNTEFHLLGMDVVSALFYMEEKFEYVDEKVAILNFASYKHPGGKFIEGSIAQEEALCHQSTLYNVLVSFKDSYYSKNRCRTNDSLYGNEMLYSPDIIFTHPRNRGIGYADVMTSAAPNTKAAILYQKISYGKCFMTMVDRIDHLLYHAYEQKVDVLYLGAYGCGVFGNDIFAVFSIFILFLLRKYKGCFRDIIFPIPPHSRSREGNYQKVLWLWNHRDMKAGLKENNFDLCNKEIQRLFNSNFYSQYIIGSSVHDRIFV